MLTIEPGAEGVVVVAGRLDAAQAATAQAFQDGVKDSITLEASRLDASRARASACRSRPGSD